MKYRLQFCAKADREHDRSPRQYAHTMHWKNTICVADEWADLPRDYRLGILLHELGHLTLQKTPQHQEWEADKAIELLSGIQIQHTRDGHDIQYVSHKDVGRASSYVKRMIDSDLI